MLFQNLHSTTCQQHCLVSRGSILDNQLQLLLHSTSRRWPLGANQLSRPKSGLNWFNHACDWFGAIKEIALRSRGFSRGSEIKAWRKPRKKSLWHPGYKVRKLMNKLNYRKTKFVLTCSFQKMIRTLAFRGREKFDNSFYFKIHGIVW